MSSPELADEMDGLEASLTQDPPDQGATEITNENALVVIAQTLVGIEKHLFAQVYLMKTRNPDQTHITYLADVFDSIYDGSDPFHEVDMAVKAAAEKAKAGSGDVG